MIDKATLHQLVEELPDGHTADVGLVLATLKESAGAGTIKGVGALRGTGASSLYETDFYQWTQTQAAALRDTRLKWLMTLGLDVENLAEEIESVGRRERFAIESQLVRLLLHLLKLAAASTARPRRGWRVTIAHAREEIAKRATGSLQHHPTAYLPDAYRQARHHAALALDRPLTEFPEACPWPMALILSPDFFPEAEG
jgi:hypothetical protein